MTKMEKNVGYALGYVLEEKREWLALANRELNAAIAMENNESADYWREQIARTSGAIGALEEVAEMVNSEEEL